MPVPLDIELPIRDTHSGFLIGYVTILSRLTTGPCKPNEAAPQGWIKLDVTGRGYAWLQWHERRRTLATDDVWVRESPMVRALPGSIS